MNRTGVAAPPQQLRFLALALAIAAGGGYLAWHMVQLQVVQHADLRERAEAQGLRSRAVPAPRGSLYDAAGTPLAVSEPTWQVVCDPEYMGDKLRATVELSRLLGVPREELRREFEQERNGRVVARGLREAEPGETDVIAAIRKLRLEGVRVEREWTRRYGQPGLAAHVLGVVGDGRGLAGIEQAMDEVLRGRDGRERSRVDAIGRPVGHEPAETEPARAGAHVQLTIDMAVQRRLEEALAEAVAKHAPLGACGVVVRPSTGEILAMASWPTFDPVQRTNLQPEALKNLVTSLNYEPGSTLKPLIAGAAVADGISRWSESVFCENGVWTFRGRTIHDHSFKHGGHQHLTVVRGIALSDNILMAKLGTRMGPPRLAWWVAHLGFGQRTGIALPGEERGQVQPASRFTLQGACMSIPMGHEIAVTPLQLAMAHAAVANGGMWMPPRIVRRVWAVEDSGRERDLPAPALPEPRRFYQPADAAQIQDAMTSVMEEGTGKRAQLDGWTSAGKTGTTEKLVGGRYSKTNHIGSFVCWAPADPGTAPAALALIVVDDPQRKEHGHYGGQVAAPYVRDVLQFTLEHLQVPASPGAEAAPIRPARRPR